MRDMLAAALAPVLTMVVLVGITTVFGMLVRGGIAVGSAGRIELRFTPAARVLSALSVAVLTVLGAVVIYKAPESRSAVVIVVVLEASFAWMLLVMFREVIVLDEGGLTKRHWYGGVTRIDWANVTRVINRSTLGYFVVVGKTGKMSIAHMVDGLDLFVAECLRHLDPAVYGNEFDKPVNNPFG